MQLIEAQIAKNNLDSDHGFATIKYDIDLTTAKEIYDHLQKTGTWLDPFLHTLYTDRHLKELPRRYTGPDQTYRENAFLWPSVNGSHWVEFFNEGKLAVKHVYDPYRSGLLEEMTPVIKQHLGVDFEQARDRIGNILFQFPVNIVNASFETTDMGKTVSVRFHWAIEQTIRPETYIQSVATDENSIIDFQTVQSTDSGSHNLPIQVFDPSLRVRIFRRNPDLILHEWHCNSGGYGHMWAKMTDDVPQVRSFTADGQPEKVELWHPNAAFNPIHHSYHSKMAITRLHSRRSYKQFEAGQYQDALQYLRGLVQNTWAREILMIDPYLTTNDILNILYFSTMFGRPLRAIGSATTKIPLKDGTAAADSTSTTDGGEGISNEKALERIKEQRKILMDSKNSSLGLTLEFRMQYGHYGIPMHDRFLLFPGNPEDRSDPMAFSIGTSFNGIGKSYHVIGSLEGAQNIIDDFENHWRMLSPSACQVFKCVNGVKMM